MDCGPKSASIALSVQLDATFDCDHPEPLCLTSLTAGVCMMFSVHEYYNKLQCAENTFAGNVPQVVLTEVKNIYGAEGFIATSWFEC